MENILLLSKQIENYLNCLVVFSLFKGEEILSVGGVWVEAEDAEKF